MPARYDSTRHIPDPKTPARLNVSAGASGIPAAKKHIHRPFHVRAHARAVATT